MALATFTPKRSTPLLPGTLKNLFFPPEKNEYQYFQRAAECPFAKGDFSVKAAWAADAAMLCYARYGSTRMTDAEFQQILASAGLKLQKKIGEDPNNWNAPGTQGFFATGDGFALLVFRGTEADDPADLRSDLNILLVPEHHYQGAASPPLGHFALVHHLFSAPCLVHQGFQSALDRVWDTVYQLISDYRSSAQGGELCIAGHSLGGALALLTYSRCADANTSAYTIGCPRTGNGGFRERVAASPGKGHFRIVNFDDLVTHVPPVSAVYGHAPKMRYRFGADGVLRLEEEDALSADLGVLEKTIASLPKDLLTNAQLLNRPAPDGLVDHSPARYCMQLWDCV